MKPSTAQTVAVDAANVKPIAAPRPVLACLALLMLLPSLDTSIANTSLPIIANAFSASFQATQWVIIAYLLTITSIIVIVGRLGDMFGRRRVLLGGILLFVAASLWCAAAPSLPILIAARAAQGLGAAIMLSLTIAFVGETIHQSNAGAAMGLLGTMSAIGTTLGPSLGGWLSAGLGWRAIFLINIPLGVAALWLAHRSLPADRLDRSLSSSARSRLDLTGTLALAITLAAYALAMTLPPGGAGWLQFTLLLGAAAGTVCFVHSQATAHTPLIQLSLLRDPALPASLAANSIVSAVIMSTLVVGPFHLSQALGLHAAQSGLALSVGPMVAALTGVPAGKFVDRIGAAAMARAGLGGMFFACVALALAPMSWGPAGYLAPIVCLTASYALFQAANNTSVMAGIHPRQRGVVAGMLSLSRNLGLITGASAMGNIFALSVGNVRLAAAAPHEVAAGTRVTFAVAAILLALAAIVMLPATQEKIRQLSRRR